MSKLNEIARISAHKAWSNSPSDGWPGKLDGALTAYVEALPKTEVTSEMVRAARDAWTRTETFHWEATCRAVLDHAHPLTDTRDAEIVDLRAALKITKDGRDFARAMEKKLREDLAQHDVANGELRAEIADLRTRLDYALAACNPPKISGVERSDRAASHTCGPERVHAGSGQLSGWAQFTAALDKAAAEMAKDPEWSKRVRDNRASHAAPAPQPDLAASGEKAANELHPQYSLRAAAANRCAEKAERERLAALDAQVARVAAARTGLAEWVAAAALDSARADLAQSSGVERSDRTATSTCGPERVHAGSGQPDLAALAEACANSLSNEPMVLFFRAFATHYRAERAERARIAALDAEVVAAIRGERDRATTVMGWERAATVNAALAARFGEQS
jgi:hypothetical protein